MALDDSNLDYVAYRNSVVQLLPWDMQAPASQAFHNEGSAAKAILDAAFVRYGEMAEMVGSLIG